MTAQQHIDFAVQRIEWHGKQNTFCRGQIDWCNRELKRTRAEDKELAEYALQSKPDDPLTLRVFGGKYVGTETRKLINERARYYREIKYNDKRIAYYKKQADDFRRYL